MANQEQWKDIPGYEGLYQVSSLGRVKALPRKVRRLMADGTLSFMTYKEHILTNFFNRKKEDKQYVSLCKNNVPRTFLVGTLVAQAFIPKPELTSYVIHINGDLTDDRVENLRWGRQYELRQSHANCRASKEKNQ